MGRLKGGLVSTFSRALGVAGAAVVVTGAAGCGTIQDRFRECREVTVELQVDRQALVGANMIIENESVGSSNFLAPGESRRVAVCVERGDRKRFIAFRDGRAVFQATCVVSFSETGAETARPLVVLQPAGIACIDW